jgi:hypothetical protein
MKLFKTGAMRNHGRHALADLNVDAAQLLVNRNSQVINLSFLGKDGSSEYSYCLSLSLQEFNLLQSKIFDQLSTNENL